MANYIIPERLREIDPDSQFEVLGGGFAFPMSITAQGSTKVTIGEENVKSCIFHIAAYRRGELYGSYSFGGNVPKLVFSVFSMSVLTQHEEWMQEALDTWEPRIINSRVTVGKATDDTENTKVTMLVQYDVESVGVSEYLLLPVEGEN